MNAALDRERREGIEATKDGDLVAAFLARTPDALELVYRAYADVLFAVASSSLGDPHEAQDCVHDALLRVWSRPESYRPERGALRSFLIVCVRNEAISRKRSAARRYEIEKSVAHGSNTSSEPEASDPIERARIRSILAELPDDQRRPLELAYFGERTQSDIARELGIPLGTVKSRITLAMRKLQIRLGVRREKP